MDLVAIDIETASPFEEPPDGGADTRYFEWVATALAYRPAEESGEESGPAPGAGTAAVETDVLFRRGGWDAEHTADMLDRLLSFLDDRPVDAVLTYNGAHFDLPHIHSWARDCEERGLREGVTAAMADDLDGHVDLALAAAERWEDELLEDQPVLPDWRAYQLADVENAGVWYDDYDLAADYLAHDAIDHGAVSGRHVGRVLGERYVDGVVAGLEDTRTHRELERLLTDYALSDVADLFALFDRLGGPALLEEHRYPLESVV